MGRWIDGTWYEGLSDDFKPERTYDFGFTRLFVSDLRRDGLIPTALQHHPELAALEAERVRLAAALAEAEQGGGWHDDSQYIAERSAALREGRELPPAPPTHAERQAQDETRQRNLTAAQDALVSFGETLRRTLASHPEWAAEAAEDVQKARDEAAELQRQAKAADLRAEEAEHYVRWLQRGADGEVYFPTFVTTPTDEPDLVWAVTDPHILDLIASSRSGAAI
jgi:hypothetical protein